MRDHKGCNRARELVKICPQSTSATKPPGSSLEFTAIAMLLALMPLLHQEAYLATSTRHQRNRGSMQCLCPPTQVLCACMRLCLQLWQHLRVWVLIFSSGDRAHTEKFPPDMQREGNHIWNKWLQVNFSKTIQYFFQIVILIF